MHAIDFQALFSLSPNPYMLLDRELRFVWANPAYLQVTASRLEDLVGRSLFEVFPNDPGDPGNESSTLLRRSFQRVIDTRKADVLALIRYRVPRYTESGAKVIEERYWSATHTPVLDAAGEVRLILQHTTDVTELQQLKDTSRHAIPLEQLEASVLFRAKSVERANRTLHAELRYLRSLFEQAPGFVCVLRGPDHVFELANHAYYRVVGHRDIIGKPIREALPDAAGQGFFELLDRVYESGEPFVGRAMPARLHRRPDAPLEEMYLDFVYQPVLEPNGQVAGIFVLGHDMTEQVLAQRELARYQQHLEELVREGSRALDESEQVRRQAEAELRQAQKMEAVGKLTGGVAHDFNNLLQIISGNLQLLQKELEGRERAIKRLKTAAEAVERGAKLSSQLLAFARRQPLDPRPLHLGNVTARLDELLRRAVGEHVEIMTRVEPGLWNTFADPNQLENLILNLAINARDAMKGEGRLDIEIANCSFDAPYAARHPGVAPGDYVMLAMSDTGCGMPPEVMERVFEPFFTTKALGEGSGLGLSMVHGFVNQSGGQVTVSSEVGKGTTFRIYLPRSQLPEQVGEQRDASPPARGSETVLVVEDDPGVRSTVAATLRELGYQVLEAADGRSALELLRGGARVDLLFSDVVMPGPVRSDELAREARRLLPEVQVLFTSGYAREAIVHDSGHPNPGVNLLKKPYKQQDLAATLRQLLGSRSDAPGPKRLLVVEDNADIRAAMVETLRELGHQVTEAGSAEAARRALGGGAFDVLFTDVALPRESGLDLARHAVQRHPNLRVVIASGNHDLARWQKELQSAVLLPKPFDLEQIEAALHRALNA